eukprot:6810-Heterococcus_DN1.PRE.5
MSKQQCSQAASAVSRALHLLRCVCLRFVIKISKHLQCTTIPTEYQFSVRGVRMRLIPPVCVHDDDSYTKANSKNGHTHNW